MKERWKRIPQFPNYEVSTLTHVRERLTKRPIKTFINKGRGSYLCATIRDVTNTRRTRGVAWLMLSAFRRPPNPNELCLHKDDKRLNNQLKNLYWGTKSQNTHDSVRNGSHPTYGKGHTEETCIKLSKSLKGSAKLIMSRTGERNPASKLTDKQRKQIIQEANKDHRWGYGRRLAKKYAISSSAIYRIVGKLRHLYPYQTQG